MERLLQYYCAPLWVGVYMLGMGVHVSRVLVEQIRLISRNLTMNDVMNGQR